MTPLLAFSPTPFFSSFLTLECTRRMREGLAFPGPCGGKGLVIAVWGPSLWGPLLGQGRPGL